MTGRQVIKILEAHGWRLARIHGSHHVMVKPGAPRSVPVPVHGTADIGKDLLKRIERQTGVKLT